ncbi:hypothetical protein AHF37_07112 [Paragonimus kellicotti]|nr:hypothetical protein AHF37_07112 [Paragonimus kellicotti]
MAHNYANLQQAQQSVRLAGYEIARGRLPDSIGPLIFVVHGDGNVSQGSQMILDSLPVQYIRPKQLNEVARNGSKNCIYVCVANVSDYMQHVDGKPFVMSEYFKEPQQYKSKFIEKIAPYMSVLINGTYWDTRIDRILTRENVKSLMNIRPDIPGRPTDEDATKPFADYNARPEVKNAIITSNGELTPNFKYIDDLRAKRTASISASSERKVLVLGAGYVVPPLVEYLTRDNNLRLTVVSNVQDELASISQNFPKIQARNVNVLEDTKPNPMEVPPNGGSRMCKQKRNLLTASYCTPVLKDMESSIQQAGITAFMEMGLDPGIDHLLTKECIDEVTQKGGRVVSYRSFTGGLPAPENSNNPLRYKFSWSPEAAMSTVMNGAKYLENGEVII